jgi:hypothetical protein
LGGIKTLVKVKGVRVENPGGIYTKAREGKRGFGGLMSGKESDCLRGELMHQVNPM